METVKCFKCNKTFSRTIKPPKDGKKKHGKRYITGGITVVGNGCAECYREHKRGLSYRLASARYKRGRKTSEEVVEDLPEFNYLFNGPCLAENNKVRSCGYCGRKTVNRFACQGCWSNGTVAMVNKGHDDPDYIGDGNARIGVDYK